MLVGVYAAVLLLVARAHGAPPGAPESCAVQVAGVTVDSLELPTTGTASTANDVFVELERPVISARLRTTPAAATAPVPSALQVAAHRIELLDLLAAATPTIGDSGWVTGNSTTNLPWPFAALAQPGAKLGLRISLRDGRGGSCGPSAVFVFSTALLPAACPRGDCWAAHTDWLAASNAVDTACSSFAPRNVPALRRRFATPSGPPAVRTLLFISGLGWYRAWLNGQAVGNHQLDPALTLYNRTILYSAYDVSGLLTAAGGSNNTLEVHLGRGWWNINQLRLFGRFDAYNQLSATGPERLRAMLVTVHADGSTATPVATRAADADWQCNTADASPILQNSVYYGEVVSTAPAASRAWGRCLLANDSAVTVEGQPRPAGQPLPVPSLTRMPPIRLAAQPSLPANWTVLDQTTLLVDFGAEMSGWLELSVPAGTSLPGSTHPDGMRVAPGEILLIYAERLNKSSAASPATAPYGVNGNSLAAGAIGRGAPGNTTVWGPCAFDWPPAGRTVALQTTLVRFAAGDLDARHQTTRAYTYTPTFTFHTWRHLEIRGINTSTLPASPAALVRGFWMHTDLAPSNHSSGRPSFASPRKPLLADIDALAFGSFRSNWAQGIQSDCPGRERLGYGGDMLASIEAALLMFSGAPAFYRKRAQDYADAQRPNGGLPETSPFVGIETCDSLGDGTGPMQWGSALIHTMHTLWRYFGDTGTAAAQLPIASAWLDLLVRSQDPATGVLHNGLIGWNDPGGCSGPEIDVLGTSFLFQQASLLSEVCTALGNSSCAARAAQAAQATQTAFRQHLIDPSSGKVGSGTQDEAIYALALGLLGPPETQSSDPLARAVAGYLAAALAKANNVFDVDAFGVWLLGELFARGFGPQIYQWFTSTARPSFGYFLYNPDQRATTMHEHWDSPGSDLSHNHAWLNSISLHLRARLAGIGSSAAGIELRPWLVMPTAEAEFSASFETLTGVISAGWAVMAESESAAACPAGLLPLNLTVFEAPPNTRLTVSVPVGGASGPPAALVTDCPGVDAASATTASLGGLVFATVDATNRISRPCSFLSCVHPR